jgi:tetratricopeptide (TPR) repeat protein
MLCLAGAPLSAHADDTADARRLYTSGTKHFDLAEYEEALTDFKEGYRHKDDPVFLYNIAQCYRLLNKNEEAVRFYRNYLRKVPKASNRNEVEQKIETLQQAIALQEKARTTPPSSTLKPDEEHAAAPAQSAPAAAVPVAAQPAPTTTTTTTTTTTELHAAAPARKPAYKKWWVWTIVGGVAAVGLGVGLGFGLSRSSTPQGSSFPPVGF